MANNYNYEYDYEYNYDNNYNYNFFNMDFTLVDEIIIYALFGLTFVYHTFEHQLRNQNRNHFLSIFNKINFMVASTIPAYIILRGMHVSIVKNDPTPFLCVLNVIIWNFFLPEMGCHVYCLFCMNIISKFDPYVYRFINNNIRVNIIPT